MFRIKIPFEEKLKSISGDLELQEYHIYSSIFLPTPKLTLSIKTPYETPDALELYLGTSFPIQYVITNEEDLSAESEDENIEKSSEEEKSEDPVDLSGMYVSQIEMESSGSSSVTHISCDSDFLVFQRSDIRKAYTAKYGNEIVQDVLDSNKYLNTYGKLIQSTDNSATVYRTLGDTDASIILNYVNKAFTIAGGTPIFYIGLDRKIHFTSINKLTSKTDRTKILIRTSATDDAESEKVKAELLQNYTDQEAEDSMELTATNFKLTIGKNNAMFNLKNLAYYTAFAPGITNTTGYAFEPARENKTYYPVEKVFMSMSTANQAVAVNNRPGNNFCYEAKNYFESAEELISVRLTLADCSKFKKLIVAGDMVTLVLPYAYSVYNGNYLISEIEYGQKGTNPFAEVNLIRPNLDFNWSDKLEKAKDSENFKFSVAPEVNKSILYSI